MADYCLGIKKIEETKAYSFWTKCAREMFEKGTSPHWIVVISIPGVGPSTHLCRSSDRGLLSALVTYSSRLQPRLCR